MENNQYVFHEDSGHGWLEVPIETIVELGITNKITQYSYIDQHSVYLEEDGDLTTFIHTLNANGIPFDLNTDIISAFQDDTPIRRMRSYNPALLQRR